MTNKVLRRFVIRAFLWTIVFYLIIIFSMIYFKDKTEVKNWEVLLVFIPLLVFAISSESLSKTKKIDTSSLRPYSVTDVVLKGLSFCLANLFYQKLRYFNNFIIMIIIVSFFFIVSIIMDFIMYKTIVNTKTE